MKKKESKLQLVQEGVQAAINQTNEKIEDLGAYTNELCTELNNLQESLDDIRNMAMDKKLEFKRLREIRLNWKQQAEKIERNYKADVVKATGEVVGGVSAGVAVAALGSTAAMGVATTFGVASTGTAISALSGAAATNAALAWLGGGAIAAGGGGMVAGNALLALSGPVGWAIAGVALLASGITFWETTSNKKRIENIFILIGNSDVKAYELAIVELGERIERIRNEKELLKDAIIKVRSFGTDYETMTEAQQYELGAYVNLMRSSTQLLVNPIMGLQPKFSESDFDKFICWKERKADTSMCKDFKGLIIYFANLLYGSDLDDTDKKLLYKTFKKDKEMLKALNVKNKDFTKELMNIVFEALEMDMANY
jgi:hypothetical protein